ncbi:MAG: hypothetical protein V1799_21500 [bacterium]
MSYTTRRVDNRRSMNDFLQLPRLIYQGDQNWIPPLHSEVRRVLDPERNPYFARGEVCLVVCYHDDVPVSRCAVVVNHSHWERFGQRTAFFGFFESFNDIHAVCNLFQHVEQLCRAKGINTLEGPFNPNHYSELGMQINKFGDAPAFFQPYNPSYYPMLMEQAGFRVSKNLHTRKNTDIAGYVRRRYGDLLESKKLPDFTVRTFHKKDLQNELERIREVFNDAFSENWYFLPLSKEEYDFSAKYLDLVTLPELIIIVEYKHQPVGVLECVLDINPLLKKLDGRVGTLKYFRFLQERRCVRNLLIYAVGIKKHYQGSRIYRLLLQEMVKIALHYQTLETTWMSDENLLALRAAEHLGLERDKEFAIYRKELCAVKQATGVLQHHDKSVTTEGVS